MENAVGTNHRVRFKAFELDLHTRELYRNGLRLRVQGQPIDVLEMLLERPGELVTREQLRKKLWPEDTFVDFEHSLNSAVTRLRDALGDRAEDPKFIETLPRLGYRFVGSIEKHDGLHDGHTSSIDQSEISRENGDTAQLRRVVVNESLHEELAISKPELGTRLHRWHWPILIASSVVLSAMALLWHASRPLPAPHISKTERITNDANWLAKRVLGTDGSRVLVSLLYPPALGQVQVQGGEITTIPIRVPDFTPYSSEWLGWVSPDGNSVLVYGAFHSASDPRKEGSDLWVAATTGSPIRFLTRTGSSGYTASWSQDGKEVVFSTNEGKIYTIPSVGGEPRLIRALDATSNHFAYSPDGRKIRFTFHKNDARRIWEMSSVGSDLHELLPNWRPGQKMYSVQWTPDGDFFLFLVQDIKPSGVYGSPPFEIWALDERHTVLRRSRPEPILLASGPVKWLGAVPSRDGKVIFSQGQTVRGELIRYNRQTRQLEPFLGARSVEMVDFSRDGKYVTYSSFPDGILWRANRDGTGLQQVSKAPVWYPVNPRFSPDGSQIVFVDRNPGPWISAMYLVSSQGGTPVRLLPDDKVGYQDPTWSPDGKQLAFLERRGGETVVRILNLSSREVSTLPRVPEHGWSPRWSPDGRYIVCITHSLPDNNGLEVFDFKTRAWKVLFTENMGVDWPSWSRESRSIYFMGSINNRVGIYRVFAEGGRKELITDLPGFRGTGYGGAWVGLDPDDNPLFLREAGTTEVYSLTLER